ncbi:hypothetical protein LPJ66_003487 [Kickxella alabastrina]|uniref:Uncharacterized protein n=1 Tax=Kickxella alabastrina TaxID=61397 RepID=A0ACC1IJM5_9FUNG|nr:hypothetical protein LPJ66_003487 [Kickxella alabastrina]
MLPSKLQGRMNLDVDINSVINDITYFFELPKDQWVIVQDAYASTQKILTICSIISMLIAGIRILSLAPHDLSEKPPKYVGSGEQSAAAINVSNASNNDTAVLSNSELSVDKV